MIRRLAVSCAPLAVTLFAAATAQAQIPDEFSNLKLLDPEISKQELVGVMRSWALGLGVRCNYCHVGPDDLTDMDFASDEKAHKRTARRMLEMSREINGELLANLPTAKAGESQQVVSCYTCHRARSRPPRQIAVELSAAAEAGGIEGALARYEELRQDFYGAGVYDLSAAALNDIAGRLLQAGRAEDAVEVLEKNLEYHPGSADIHSMIGMVRLQSGDLEAARAAVERALELDSENAIAARVMQLLEASPPREEGEE